MSLSPSEELEPCLEPSGGLGIRSLALAELVAKDPALVSYALELRCQFALPRKPTLSESMFSFTTSSAGVRGGDSSDSPAAFSSMWNPSDSLSSAIALTLVITFLAWVTHVVAPNQVVCE